MAKILIVGNDGLQTAYYGSKLKSHQRVYTTLESARYNYRENPDIELAVLADDSPRTLSVYKTLRNEDYDGPFLILAQQRVLQFPPDVDVHNIHTLLLEERKQSGLEYAVAHLLCLDTELQERYSHHKDPTVQQPAQ